MLSTNSPSTWWLEGASGTPQVGGSTPGLGLKKSHSPIPLKAHSQGLTSRHGRATGPCVRVGKAHVPKHKLMTGPWVVLTGDGPLCMGGCGVREVFSACVRRLLLNIKPWGRSFPYRSSFCFVCHAIHLGRDKIVDFHWNSSDPWTIVSVSDDGESTGGGGTLQVLFFLEIWCRPR
jgi:hypothetical protein